MNFEDDARSRLLSALVNRPFSMRTLHWQKGNIQKGRCRYCCRKPRTGKKTCAKCHERKMKRLHDRVAAGLCRACDLPRVNATCCETHRLEGNERRRAYVKRKRARLRVVRKLKRAMAEGAEFVLQMHPLDLAKLKCVELPVEPNELVPQGRVRLARAS